MCRIDSLAVCLVEKRREKRRVRNKFLISVQFIKKNLDWIGMSLVRYSSV